MENWTEERIEEMLKKVEGNYKYTKLTNSFIRTVLGNRLYMINETYVSEVGKSIINPTKHFKLIIGVDKIYPVYALRILQNDFELTDMEGHLDVSLSKQWQEGMIKRALPLQSKRLGLDVSHYIGDLKLYLSEKVTNRTGELFNMALARQAEEQDD